jgi:hypothetical protein
MKKDLVETSFLSLQPRFAQVFDDTICYRLWERKDLGITLQREFGIYPEDLYGCGPLSSHRNLLEAFLSRKEEK